MDTTCSSETSVNFQRTTRRSIPEDRTVLGFSCPTEREMIEEYIKRQMEDHIVLEQRFSTDVSRHTSVTRRVRRCAAGVWGKVEKKREKMNNKKTLHHWADYFIQNFIFHYFIEKERGCVTEGERRGRGHFFEANGIRYRILLQMTFFNDISFQYLEY
jgi:hypothetical protein